MKIKIEYRKDDNDYIAYIDSKKSYLGSGIDAAQAIGNLIRAYPDVFGVKFEYLVN